MKEITYWVIRHIPTKRILATADSTGHGRGNTRVNIKDDGLPRMFETKDKARRALGKWLEGEHKNDWDDGIMVNAPSIPRVREDMEVIPVTLKVLL